MDILGKKEKRLHTHTMHNALAQTGRRLKVSDMIREALQTIGV